MAAFCDATSAVLSRSTFAISRTAQMPSRGVLVWVEFEVEVEIEFELVFG